MAASGDTHVRVIKAAAYVPTRNNSDLAHHSHQHCPEASQAQKSVLSLWHAAVQGLHQRQ
jgi:hypothetical protein